MDNNNNKLVFSVLYEGKTYRIRADPQNPLPDVCKSLEIKPSKVTLVDVFTNEEIFGLAYPGTTKILYDEYWKKWINILVTLLTAVAPPLIKMEGVKPSIFMHMLLAWLGSVSYNPSRLLIASRFLLYVVGSLLATTEACGLIPLFCIQLVLACCCSVVAYLPLENEEVRQQVRQVPDLDPERPCITLQFFIHGFLSLDVETLKVQPQNEEGTIAKDNVISLLKTHFNAEVDDELQDEYSLPKRYDISARRCKSIDRPPYYELSLTKASGDYYWKFHCKVRDQLSWLLFWI